MKKAPDKFYSYEYKTYHHPSFRQYDQIYNLTEGDPVVFSSKDKVSKVVSIKFYTDNLLSEKIIKKINKIFNCKAKVKMETFY